MNRFKSLKCATVLLPALAMGIPLAYASDEKRNDPSQAAVPHQYLETMPVRGYDSDSLVGQAVNSRSNNKSIGKVSNLLLDENDQIVAVIISVGGVLGMGERDVAIAWNQIERRVDGDEATLWVNLTEQSLKNAPKYTSAAEYSRRQQQQAKELVEQRADQRQVTAHHHYLANLPARGYHSDSLVGHDVMNRRNNKSVGTVSNLLLDENGQVLALIVSVGGIMGMGQRDLAIEWDQVQRKVDGDDITLSVDLTAASLKDAPKYARR